MAGPEAAMTVAVTWQVVETGQSCVWGVRYTLLARAANVTCAVAVRVCAVELEILN
jgi:hypothetical protein